MATVYIDKPVITPGDRLGLTLSIAVLIHAMIILGLTFGKEKAPRNPPRMKIVLVKQESAVAETAKLLAQTNLEGGGETEEITDLPNPSPVSSPDLQLNEGSLTKTPPLQPTTPITVEKTKPQPEPVEKTTGEKIARLEAPVTDMVAEKIETRLPEETTAKKPETLSATQLMANSKIALLNEKIRQTMEARAKNPRRKFISASTKEYKYAAYMEAWRLKVERVGNLNYPEQARKKKLSGSLILDVAINADGTIHEITIQRSSGEKILDDAAVRIVKLSAPYAPFPQHIKDETDVLHIMRTWQFINRKGFQ